VSVHIYGSWGLFQGLIPPKMDRKPLKFVKIFIFNHISYLISFPLRHFIHSHTNSSTVSPFGLAPRALTQTLDVIPISTSSKLWPITLELNTDSSRHPISLTLVVFGLAPWRLIADAWRHPISLTLAGFDLGPTHLFADDWHHSNFSLYLLSLDLVHFDLSHSHYSVDSWRHVGYPICIPPNTHMSLNLLKLSVFFYLWPLLLPSMSHHSIPLLCFYLFLLILRFRVPISGSYIPQNPLKFVKIFTFVRISHIISYHYDPKQSPGKHPSAFDLALSRLNTGPWRHLFL